MRSISTRLLLIMLSISFFGQGLITLINGIMNGNSIHEQSLGHISALTALSSQEINTWLLEQICYIDAMAIDFSALKDESQVLPLLRKHEQDKPDFFCVYIGYPDGTGIFSDEWEPDYNEWQANQRDWYTLAAASPDKSVITDLYQDATTSEFIITVSRAIFTDNGGIAGVIAADIFITTVAGIISKSDIGEESYSFLTDESGNIIVHKNSQYTPYLDANEDTIFSNVYKIENGKYKNLQDIGKQIIEIKGADGVRRYYKASETINGWIVFNTIPINVVNAPIYNMIHMSVILLIIILVSAGLLIYFSIRSLIVHPIKDVTEAANALASGEQVKYLDGKYHGEIALLAESFRSMERFNSQQTEWLEQIAEGNLSFEVQPRGANDRTAHAINNMISHLNTMLAGINHNSVQVASSSGNMAESARNLAEGANEQGAVIEKLSYSIKDIEDKTLHNAAVAKEAADLSKIIKKNAENGSAQMSDMMKAVTEINDASEQISKVIKVIDDIAFQTNILALNAAVEAARAGQHGKGFAVVAEEVRNLAAKSGEAAKSTSELIANSVEKANLGLEIATKTNVSLSEIVDGINKSAENISRIAEDSKSQAHAIGELHLSIDQISGIVQTNSATAQESSAASIEMNGQSEELKQLIARFKTK